MSESSMDEDKDTSRIMRIPPIQAKEVRDLMNRISATEQYVLKGPERKRTWQLLAKLFWECRDTVPQSTMSMYEKDQKLCIFRQRIQDCRDQEKKFVVDIEKAQRSRQKLQKTMKE